VAWPLPFSVPVAPKAVKVVPPSELTLKITVPVGVTPVPVTVAVSVTLPPTVIVVADSKVAVNEAVSLEQADYNQRFGGSPALGAVIARIAAVDSLK